MQQAWIPCGKVNMDEFAMGSTTKTSFYGANKESVDITKVPGGSSGGAAAAVAADEKALLLSVPIQAVQSASPCSFCGVTGLKPTLWCSFPGYGLIAYASSLDRDWTYR